MLRPIKEKLGNWKLPCRAWAKLAAAAEEASAEIDGPAKMYKQYFSYS